MSEEPLSGVPVWVRKCVVSVPLFANVFPHLRSGVMGLQGYLAHKKHLSDQVSRWTTGVPRS